MSNKVAYTASTMSSDKAPSLDEMQKLMGKLKHDQLSILANFVNGLKVIPDDSGLMCGPNEYVVWMGRKLYDELKEHIQMNQPAFITTANTEGGDE